MYPVLGTPAYCPVIICNNRRPGASFAYALLIVALIFLFLFGFFDIGRCLIW